MNFLGYFVLAVAMVLVSSAKQSDAVISEDFIENERERDTNRNIRLDENEEAMIFSNLTQAYDKIIQLVKSSEMIMMDGFNEAGNSTENTEVVKKKLLQAFEAARSKFYQSGLPGFSVIATTFGLLNDGARSGLTAASILIQKTGRAIISALNVADSFSIDGIDAGGKAATALLEAARLTIDSAFKGAFKNIQLSKQIATQTVKDAQSSPMQGQAENTNSKAAENDREASDAINEIDKAAKNELNRGANPQLVQKLKKIAISSLDDIVIISEKAKRIIENFEKTKGMKPLAAKISYSQQTESIIKDSHDVTAKMILGFGEVAPQSDNQSNKKIVAAIMAIEEGLIEILLGIETAEDLIVNGFRCGSDDVIALALEAAAKIIFYGKLAFNQGIVKAVKQVLSVF